MSKRQLVLAVVLGVLAWGIYRAIQPKQNSAISSIFPPGRTGKCVPSAFTLTGWAWQWDDTGEIDYRIPCVEGNA